MASFITIIGPRQAKRITTTMAMSTATFFSRKNITDSCCASSWPTIWLLWRRMARNILKWLIAGSTINITPKLNRVCCGRRLSGIMKCINIVTENQAEAVMTAVLAIPKEKRKKVVSLLIFCINLKQAEGMKMNMYVLIYFYIYKSNDGNNLRKIYFLWLAPCL